VGTNPSANNHGLRSDLFHDKSIGSHSPTGRVKLVDEKSRGLPGSIRMQIQML